VYLYWAKNCLHNSPSFIALAFWNGLEYRNADGCINSGDDPSASRINLVSFGLVSLEFSKLGSTVYSRRRKRSKLALV